MNADNSQKPVVDDDRRITYFAATHTRGKREMFGIRGIDRGKHVYVIGKTGMGKSTMLENMAIQDIQHGEGIAFIDPHGSTAEKLLDFVPHDRINDVIYFAPFDTENPMGFNIMEDIGFDQRHLVVAGLMGALKRIWVDAWSARMEYILQNTLLALLEYPGSTLLDVNRLLVNKTFRDAVIEKVTDPIVRSFWLDEFANFTDTYTREALPAIQNKIGQFVSNPLIRNIVGQPKSSFNLRQAMDEKKIFIVNLSKGRMGETNASLLGSMLTVKIYLAAMSRADEPPSRMAKLPRCFFYVDEFQSMMNEAFADILSESRKYKLALTLANQYIEQMEETVRDAVFGNVGTLITFRVGPFDAETLKTVFEPTFLAEDLVNLGLGQIYLTLMIDGVGSQPFSAETIPPIEKPVISYKDDVVVHSRAAYARTRSDIEQYIAAKQAEFVAPPREAKKKTYGPQGGGYSQNNAPQQQSQSPLAALRSTRPAQPTPAIPPPTIVHDERKSTFNFQPTLVVNRNTVTASFESKADQRSIVQPETPHRPIEQIALIKKPDPRTSLRDAIEAARAKPVAPAAASAFPPRVKTPAEIMREKMQKNPNAEPSPVPVSKVHPTQHTHTHMHIHQPHPAAVVPPKIENTIIQTHVTVTSPPVERVSEKSHLRQTEDTQPLRQAEDHRPRTVLPPDADIESDISPEMLRKIIGNP
jgi:energy-coupling factor transporter ATP-binding protein EcfA2